MDYKKEVIEMIHKYTDNQKCEKIYHILCGFLDFKESISDFAEGDCEL